MKSDYNNYHKYGFKREDVEKILGISLSKNAPQVTVQNNITITGSSPTPASSIEWGSFAGRETALMFIAGMAIALEKTKPTYRHGKKMNKSSIANAAITAVENAGYIGESVTPRQLTNLINEALAIYAPKVSDEQ